jgi:outer membrane translocation and assembly module TamA
MEPNMAVAKASAAKPVDLEPENDAPQDVKKTDEKTETKATESYIDQAAKLATDVRALAEKMREDLAEVEERCAKVNETAPEAAAYAAADGVRRIPMATVDVHHALEGLVHAAAELATKAQHTEAE